MFYNLQLPQIVIAHTDVHACLPFWGLFSWDQFPHLPLGSPSSSLAVGWGAGTPAPRFLPVLDAEERRNLTQPKHSRKCSYFILMMHERWVPFPFGRRQTEAPGLLTPRGTTNQARKGRRSAPSILKALQSHFCQPQLPCTQKGSK